MKRKFWIGALVAVAAAASVVGWGLKIDTDPKGHPFKVDRVSELVVGKTTLIEALDLIGQTESIVVTGKINAAHWTNHRAVWFFYVRLYDHAEDLTLWFYDDVLWDRHKMFFWYRVSILDGGKVHKGGF